MGILKMDCDDCSGRNFNEVFILRKNKFSKSATKLQRKMKRVCWGCARRLFKSKIYNFGHNWRCVFLDSTLILERNKYKYMVIHA